ncbi:hypothetical protein [Actinomycetospora sp. TBRC 11914]|uniref:hypothetical protein n=1 Tax=Actinomycetospora sp. TBRC 11914 TaxID=2729387 RepID=UPI00145D0179|nr:hypothetical protein [Actinomycetospora sp. TBRC 11914]NMO89755.1 STAS domain-containing protein [Actinomycetospora sp. TBRC 11914]
MDTSDDRADPRHTGNGFDPEVDQPRSSIIDSRTGTRVITAGPVLHATAVAQLRRVAKALLAHSDDPLLIDLTAVRYAESAASVVLRDLAYEAGDANIDLRVVLDPAAHEVTRAVLDDETLFEIYPDLDAALPHPATPADPDAGRPLTRTPRGTPPGGGTPGTVAPLLCTFAVTAWLMAVTSRAPRSARAGALPSQRSADPGRRPRSTPWGEQVS